MSPSDRNKTGQRARLGAAHLRVVMGEGGKSEPTNFDVVGVTLGYRMVFSEQAEVWTVTAFCATAKSSRRSLARCRSV
jgi:hypothetical protein